MAPQRGEVWWVRLDPGEGSEICKTRPCVVVTTNILNRQRRAVVVVPLSSSPTAAPPLLVPISCGDRPAVAVVDQIRAVAKERLESLLGSLSVPDLELLENALRRVLELG